MVRNRAGERRREAIASQKRMERVRIREKSSPNATFPSAKRSTAPMSRAFTRATSAQRHSAFARARALNQRANAAQLWRSRSKSDETSRIDEVRWLIAHRREYPGMWLAVEGNVLVASSASLVEALQRAEQKSVRNPLVVWSEDVSEAPFGGW